MKEEWRLIKSFPYYEISSFGNVRRIKNGNIIKHWITNAGYCQVHLCDGSTRKAKSVHRLVAIEFLENKLNKPQVNHIDGNKQNNILSNLEWSTRSENQRHSIKTGLRTGVKGSSNKLSKLTEIDIYIIKDLYKRYKLKQSTIVRFFDVSPATICHIVNGKSWRHV